MNLTDDPDRQARAIEALAAAVSRLADAVSKSPQYWVGRAEAGNMTNAEWNARYEFKRD